MEKELNSKIKVDGYGDMLAKILEKELVAYQEYGSYKGDYLAVLKENDSLYFYVDSYGSCSGCDWLDAERDWSTGEVEYKVALEYCKDFKPIAILPERIWRSLTDEQKQSFVPKDMFEEQEMKEKIITI